MNTRSLSSKRARGGWWRRRGWRATAAATRRRFGLLGSTRMLLVCGAVEGAGRYGAGLVRSLSERGETVFEVGRSARGERRLRGRDDGLDAVRAPRAALRSEPLPLPRSGERREALRLLLLARRGAVDARREALVQLRSVIVTAPERLREELRGLPVQRA